MHTPAWQIGAFVFYVLATLLYVLRIIFKKPWLSALALRLTMMATLVSAVGLILTYSETVYVDLANYYTLTALALSCFFIVLCFFKKFYVTGPLFLTVIVVLMAQALVSSHSVVAGSPYLILHLMSIFLALAIFFVALISALFFLISENQIKMKRLSSWISKLPSLEILDQVHYKSLLVGFFFFSAAILLGALYEKQVTGRFISDDLKQILSLVIWIFFVLFLNFRVRQGWQGHKGVLLSLIGFLGLGFLFLIAL